MNFDEMAEKVLAAFPFGKLDGADASESELRAAARAAIDEAVANVRVDGPWSDGRAGGFEARVRRGRRPDCAYVGGTAFWEDLLTLDLWYAKELHRVHIAGIEPREKDLQL
jgi:hypothetical protein